MDKRFKVPMFKEWAVTDDCVIVGEEKVAYSLITKVEYDGMPTSKFKNGVATVWVGNKFYTLGYPFKQKEDGDAAIKFLIDSFYSAHKKEIDEYNKEHRMRCNVCGNIFCYSEADVRANKALIEEAKSNARASVANALLGTDLNAHAFINRAERAADKVRDFSRCPKCNSTNLTELSDDGPIPIASEASSLSPAEELKKFKELLDMGAITQEEFNAKKKQLLGL